MKPSVPEQPNPQGSLHAVVRERLVALKTTDELDRQAFKARRQAHWTQEDLDCARRHAEEIMRALNWGGALPNDEAERQAGR
jgi:hypothetical protein